jgi:hypothetical protein
MQRATDAVAVPKNQGEKKGLSTIKRREKTFRGRGESR